MPKTEKPTEQAIREAAYFIWEREGRPEGRAQDHWGRAVIEMCPEARKNDDEPLEDEEKLLAERADVNMSALLTKDVPGG